MNAILVAHYKKIRRENNYPAKLAWYYAKHAIKDVSTYPLDQLFDYEGFKVKIKAEPDDCIDISMFGEFTNKRVDGAILVNRHDSRRYKYFVPMTTLAEHKAYFRSIGYSRNDATLLARKNVMQDYEQAKDYSPLVACVQVFKNGVKIAYNYLGGIDDYNEVISTVIDCGTIDKTIDEAREVLKQLCSCSTDKVEH